MHRTLGDLEQARKTRNQAYLEFLRIPDLSAGLYVLAASAHDPQQPHSEDELYVVLGGVARIRVGDQDYAVGVGDTVFVPAHMPHQFYDITEELRLIVVFGPSEYSKQNGGA